MVQVPPNQQSLPINMLTSSLRKKSSMVLRQVVMMNMETKMKKRVMLIMETMAKKRRVMKKCGIIRNL